MHTSQSATGVSLERDTLNCLFFLFSGGLEWKERFKHLSIPWMTARGPLQSPEEASSRHQESQNGSGQPAEVDHSQADTRISTANVSCWGTVIQNCHHCTREECCRGLIGHLLVSLWGLASWIFSQIGIDLGNTDCSGEQGTPLVHMLHC